MPMPENETKAPGLARRGLAMLYDGLLLVALWFGVSAVLLAISAGLLTEPGRPLWLAYAHRLSLVLATLGFFGWFWTHGGQTLGMRAWRLRLVSSVEHGAVTWKQSVLRLATACLSVSALGLGFFWSWIDPKRRTWHDRLSGTELILLPKNSGSAHPSQHD